MTNTFLAWIPVVISSAAFAVALTSLIFTLSARPKPLVEAHDRVGLGGVMEAHVVSVYNVGRRSLTIRRAGLVRRDDTIVYEGQPTDGPANENPVLPHTVDPGRVATFYFSIDLDADPDREGWEYRIDWLKGRKRDGSARTAMEHVMRPRMPDIIYPA